MANQITIDRDELKSLVKELMREVITENKPLLKDIIAETAHEQGSNGASPKVYVSSERFDALLEESLVRYEKVWKALA
jgi:hypothetical protein